MTLDSIRKARTLDIQQILLPHYGVISGEEAAIYLANGEPVAKNLAQLILQLLSEGRTKEEIFFRMTDILYTEQVRPVYPYAAFRLNSEIMINLIQKELFMQ